MSGTEYKPSSPKELEREAEEWNGGVRTPAGWKDAPEAVPMAGASTAISLRMPNHMLDILKAFAGREGVGYQVLLKRWLDERIREERERMGEAEAADEAPVLELSLAGSTTVLLRILEKLYSRPDGGLPETGLMRGLQKRKAELVPKILELLAKEGLAIKAALGERPVWMATRGSSHRVRRLLSEGQRSKDVLMKMAAGVK